MRSRGYRITPFNASKLPALFGILLAGSIGAGYGSSYGARALGNSNQYYYLMGNRGAIMKGDMPFDDQKTE